MGTPSRSRTWHQVWDKRDPDRLRLDGYEATVSKDGGLEALRATQAAFMIDTLELSQGDHLLDLGCGTGALAALLAPHVGALTAVDYSADATELARQNLAPFPAATVVHADLTALDVESVAATKVVAMGSLHYLDSYEQLVSLIGRATAMATMLIVDLPDSTAETLVSRDYDVEVWSHLKVDPDQLLADFPGTQLFRGVLPGYSNDAERFSALIPSTP